MPTVAQTPRTQDEKRLRCRILLGVLLVHVDPEKRLPTTLAERMGVTRQYVHRCINKGRCDRPFALSLQKEFGPALAPADELCWPKIDA